MSLYLRRVSHSGLDWPSKLTLDQFLPLHAPLLDFLVEDAKRIDAWKYPRLEELEKYQRIRGLDLKMLDRIEVRELVCGVSSASEILEVRKWIEKMQDADQRSNCKEKLHLCFCQQAEHSEAFHVASYDVKHQSR